MYAKSELENRSMVELMMKALMSTINEETKGKSDETRQTIIDSLIKKFVKESGMHESINSMRDMLNTELDEVVEEMNDLEDELASEFTKNFDESEYIKEEPTPENMKDEQLFEDIEDELDPFTDGEVLGIAIAGAAVGALLGFGLATLFND